jgi:ubiquinone/menaquinone biosynthesis C-methylase UbiE
VNERHLEALASDEWRKTLETMAFPFAFGPGGPAILGDDPLEIGPGPGMTTDLLRASLPRLTSIELDVDLAVALQARLAGTNVTVVEGDATQMPFEDGRFSGAAMFTMLHHVPTIEAQDRIFNEVARVLRPGGMIVANDGVARPDFEALHDNDIYNPVDPATIESRLTAAGFVEIDVKANEYAWAVRARSA